MRLSFIGQPLNIKDDMNFRNKISNRVKDILLFLKHPQPEQYEIETNGSKILRITIQYFIIIFTCTLFISILLSPIKQLDICPRLIHKRLPLTIYVILIDPILEELIFRLPLRFTSYNILISISLLLLFLSKNNIYLVLSISLAMVIFGYFLYTNTLNIKSHLEYLWKYHFTIIFYLFAIFFGLLHISNYKVVTPIQYLLLVLLVLPQIVGSLIMGYVRVKYCNGIIITIMIHILYNLSALGLNALL